LDSDLVARVASSNWARTEDIRAAILILCTETFQTVGQLAQILNRKGSTIQQNYVSKMVRDGDLELRFPDTLHHPAQAYRRRFVPKG
jgi:ATP-dependent DNA helicase RecG